MVTVSAAPAVQLGAVAFAAMLASAAFVRDGLASPGQTADGGAATLHSSAAAYWKMPV
jgi:hypothetical protein